MNGSVANQNAQYAICNIMLVGDTANLTTDALAMIPSYLPVASSMTLSIGSRLFFSFLLPFEDETPVGIDVIPENMFFCPNPGSLLE